MYKENEKIARQWFEEMWNKPDLSVADEIVDENYNPEWVQIDAVGPAQIKHEITYFRSVFPDLEYQIIDICSEKEKVWVRYKGKGTQQGEMWGFKATNKYVEFEGATILYINEESKVYDAWGAFCFYDIFADLELVPPYYELSKTFG